MRYIQTWTCPCGHTARKMISYPKLGASETPLSVKAKKARCTKCGRRECVIRERPA